MDLGKSVLGPVGMTEIVPRECKVGLWNVRGLDDVKLLSIDSLFTDLNLLCLVLTETHRWGRNTEDFLNQTLYNSRPDMGMIRLGGVGLIVRRDESVKFEPISDRIFTAHIDRAKIIIIGCYSPTDSSCDLKSKDNFYILLHKTITNAELSAARTGY